ncbi:MAG: hypothetical protein CMM16_04310 [Rhodospirillaceae bacterium]|nr:hypothetical protein [Rhodospirillaceae bacterium]
MKKVAFGFLGLIVLVVAAALIVPSVIDWNGYKPEISAEVRKATGRTLDLTGDLEFTVLPVPRLRVSGVRLSNVPGATASHMVSIRGLRVSVAILPLIQGNIEIGHVELIDPVIELEKLADGQRNWVFGRESLGDVGRASSLAPQSAAAAAGEVSKQTTSPSAFKLDVLRIQNGTIVYRDAIRKTIERVENLTADVSAGSLTGPFQFNGELTVRDTPLTVSAVIRPLVANHAVAFRMTFGMRGTMAEIGFSGTVTDLETNPTISAKLNGNGESFGALLASLHASTPLAQLGQAFNLSATVEGSSDVVTVKDITLRLGGSKATGSIKLELQDGVRADIALRVPSIDADSLMSPAGNSLTIVGPSADPAGASTATPGRPKSLPNAEVKLPTEVEVNLDLEIDEVVAMQRRVRGVRLAASLAGGQLRLNTLRAVFSGETELSAAGKLTTPKGALSYVGKAEIRSMDLRRFLSWAGVNAAQVPADRLRRFNISGDISGDGEQMQLVNIVAQLDASRMSGGVTVALRDRLAFGASLSIDQINADAYIGKAAIAELQEQPMESPANAQLAQQSSRRNTQTSGLLAALNGFDANLIFRVGSVSYQHVAIQDVWIDSTLVNGVLRLHEASVRNFAGTSARIKGTLSSLGGVPAFKGTVAAASDDLTGAFQIARVEPPVYLRKLGKMRLTSQTDVSEAGITMDANLELGKANAKIVGGVSGWSASQSVDISLDAQHPEFARLVNLFAGGKLGLTVGQVGVKMTLKGDERAVALDLNADLDDGAFRVAGRIKTPLAVPDFDVSANVKHPNLVRLVRAFYPGFRPANSRLGGLSMAVKLVGTEQNFTIAELSGNVGPMGVSGQGFYRAAHSGARRPHLKLAMVTSTIPLSDFFGAWPWSGQPQKARRGRQSAQTPTSVRAAPTSKKRWPKDRIDTEVLGLIDANIDLRAEALLYHPFRIGQPQIVAILKDKVLDIHRAAATIFDGGFEMRGKVDGRGVPTATTSLTITNANVGKALFQAAEFDIATGILNFGMDLSARGKTQHDMIKALSGKGMIDIVNGVARGFDLQRASEKLKNIKQLGGLLGVVSSTMEGGETKFSSLRGTFDITEGIITTNDLALTADAGAGNARGTVHLPNWNMDIYADLRLTEHTSAPPFRVRAVGAPDNPRRLFEFQALQAWIMQRGIGRRDQTLVPRENQSGGVPSQSTPKDFIRGLLKNLAR